MYENFKDYEKTLGEGLEGVDFLRSLVNWLDFRNESLNDNKTPTALMTEYAQATKAVKEKPTFAHGIYNAENAQEIADKLEHLLNPNQALVTIIDGTIGIATENEKGYHPSNLKLPTSIYGEVDKLVKEANEILFPERTPKDTAKIVLSSMRS